jgi:hypothetical protein
MMDIVSGRSGKLFMLVIFKILFFCMLKSTSKAIGAGFTKMMPAAAPHNTVQYI